MRNANEGISLAAIVAKETTTGKWNGTGGGIGLGTGGIGLFIGGVSGSIQSIKCIRFDNKSSRFWRAIWFICPFIYIFIKHWF